MVTISDIEAAYTIVRPVVHQTPLLSSSTFNELTGNSVFFKAENFQRIGAFKIRGAYNKISSLSAAQRTAGVIAHSSGNHAQGVALACRLFGIKATIVMPENSVAGKIMATKEYGAEVVFCGTSTDDRERVTQELIDRHGYTLIHPYNDPVLIAGQGTVALEIGQQIRHLDYLVVPVGGGGLISGCAIAARHFFPDIRIIGVETEGANDCYQSFRSNRIVRIPEAITIADGIRTLSVGTLNFEIIRKTVNDIITIRDDEIAPMMKFFMERMKIVVEPTGAVAPAAVMAGKLQTKNSVICAVISGGNADPAYLQSIL